MIWNRAKECMSRDELAALQGKRLVKLVRYMYQHAGYYRKKMKKMGMEPGDIRGIEDLGKLPFTTREDLLESFPLGIFVMPERKIIRYHSSDRNVGIGTIAGYTQNDIEVWKECMARSISMIGLGEKDVIQVAYDHGLYAEGIGAYCGVEKVGAAVVPMSYCKSSAVTAMMRRLQVTGIISTASDLMRIARIVEEKRIKNRIRLKAAMCGGEPWTESFRKKIQDKLGINMYDIFGLDELTGLGVACECECQNGMHVQEDFFLAEILDPYRLVALPEGIRGELVFTTLQKEGIPLIRYRTMNFSRINYEKCECGRTMARIDRICERTDDILLIRGSSVYVYQIETALSGLQGIDASYYIYIRREHDLDMMDIYVEMNKIAEGLLPESEADVQHRVAYAVKRVVGMMPRVHIMESRAAKASIESPAGPSEGKRVTIVDERRHR